MAATDRPYDIVLFGATGFAGGLTAEYLARHAPAGLRWALAGRSPDKLADVRERLAALDPRLAELPLLTVDATDEASVRAVAEQTRVLATTVGPYVLYGAATVAACAAAGTDYVDLTGEPEFVDRMYTMHDRTAQRTGARLVHASGFDSVPHDLGVYFTVLQLPEDVPLRIAGYIRASGAISGGTLASALLAFSRPRKNVAAARERRVLEGRVLEGHVLEGHVLEGHVLEGRDTGPRRISAKPGRPRRDPVDGGWALPFPSLDPQVIGRSARALARYGPDFGYTHHVTLGHLPAAVAAPLAAAAVVGAAQVPPLRRALSARLAPGEGPSADKRERSWFTVTFVGEGGGRRVVTRVSGGDPAYTETAAMLAESALCLARDELPPSAGQVTSAVAMGDALTARLTAAGIRFEVLEAG